MRKPERSVRRGVWALARFLHRKQLPGEKEMNALAGCQLRPLVPKARIPNAFCPLDRAFFSFSPALGTHGAQERAKAHSPGSFKAHPRVSFIVSGFPACAPRAASLVARGHGSAVPLAALMRVHLRSSAVSSTLPLVAMLCAPTRLRDAPRPHASVRGFAGSRTGWKACATRGGGHDGIVPLRVCACGFFHPPRSPNAMADVLKGT